MLLFQDGAEDIPSDKAVGAATGGVVDISTMSAVFFVVIASCFLVILYKLMSLWLVEILVVLFCIGGIEV